MPNAHKNGNTLTMCEGFKRKLKTTERRNVELKEAKLLIGKMKTITCGYIGMQLMQIICRTKACMSAT